ncbi:MAG TPA: hypothetical protein DCS66_14105 [Flavobacteriaceae bacterium]|nr:hypothetical protein [Flavobacteriaceae bacterium]|tara:strand:- start:1088 stop:1960 length:873 start_codon:yes stop_codon:yes gene_type:complete
MEYLRGYTIKPHQVTPIGEVLFTDGTNTGLMANQQTCQAYGYTYDKATGTCRSFRFNTNLNRNINNINNKNNGSGNTNELGANTIQVNGTLNTTKGFNNNCFINGSNNEIANGVDNATVLGVGGKANRDGSLVIGGGAEIIDASDTTTNCSRKVSTVNLAGTTTDNTATKLTVNGLGGTNYINVNENSIVGFEIYITRLEVGGTSGTLGNYSYRNIKGVVRIGETSGMAFIVGFTRNIGKIGINGSAAMVDSTTGGVDSISIEVTDRNNVNNIWSATVTLHELIATNTRF